MDPLEKRTINEYLSYWKDTIHPLSANVGIVEGQDYRYIFDAGSHPDIPKELMGRPNRVILSHFHPDHCKNIEEISFDELYVGRNTYRYIQGGIIVEQEMTLTDGDVKLNIFPVPSSHAKGCLGMEVNDTYMFLGDATYAMKKGRNIVYNTQQLLALIRLLEGRKAEYVLMSHQEPFLQEKKVEIQRLKEIYDRRKPSEAYIEID